MIAAHISCSCACHTSRTQPHSIELTPYDFHLPQVSIKRLLTRPLGATTPLGTPINRSLVPYEYTGSMVDTVAIATVTTKPESGHGSSHACARTYSNATDVEGGRTAYHAPPPIAQSASVELPQMLRCGKKNVSLCETPSRCKKPSGHRPSVDLVVHPCGMHTCQEASGCRM